MNTEVQDVTMPMKGPSAKEQKPSIEDMAAHDYKILINKFKEKIETLGFQQQKRVINAMVEFPFENDKPHFVDKKERDLFFLGIQIMDCQFVLKRAVFNLIEQKGGIKQLQDELNEVSKTIPTNPSTMELITQGEKTE